ncbi:hypothetical protein [Nitrosomonas eutropha]|uniref:hypothetical protein n=1 Tax=Nitrosomonas eutropha TaxID=916 RepID=UPI000943F7C5|nr:hypothetical protein [Nitrosomonas eutropha]MXS80082.1 hypothetical protein [Nitrosomonas sp. GH22]
MSNLHGKFPLENRDIYDMMNLPDFRMLHYGTDLRVCINRLLQEILPCGWLYYASAFGSAVA